MTARSCADAALGRARRELARAALIAVMVRANACWRRTGEIAGAFTREIVRLNHACVAPTLMRNRTRRERARLVKAALLERYQTHHRCC